MRKYIFICISIILTLIISGCSSLEEKGSITLLSPKKSLSSDNGVMNTAITLFNKRYPNVKVNINPIDEYDTVLSKKISTADRDFDIYIVDDENRRNSTYLSGAVDLSAYKKVITAFSNMYSNIKNLCTYKSKLCGIPIDFKVYGLMANKNLFDNSQISLPDEKWTWDDFFRMAVKCKLDIDKDSTFETCFYGNSPSSLFSMILYSGSCFKAGKSSGSYMLDRQKVLYYIEKVKEMYDNNFIAYDRLLKDQFEWSKEEYLNNRRFLSTCAINFIKLKEESTTEGHSDNVGIKSENVCLPLPEQIDNRSFPPSLWQMCINKNSANKKLAADFLCTFLSDDLQKDFFSSRIYKGENVYKKSEYFNDHFNNSLYISELYDQTVKKVPMYSVNQTSRDMVKKIFDNFFSGKITAGNAVDEICSNYSKILIY